LRSRAGSSKRLALATLLVCDAIVKLRDDSNSHWETNEG
jgi:hypothetical protein